MFIDAQLISIAYLVTWIACVARVHARDCDSSTYSWTCRAPSPSLAPCHVSGHHRRVAHGLYQLRVHCRHRWASKRRRATGRSGCDGLLCLHPVAAASSPWSCDRALRPPPLGVRLSSYRPLFYTPLFLWLSVSFFIQSVYSIFFIFLWFLRSLTFIMHLLSHYHWETYQMWVLVFFLRKVILWYTYFLYTFIYLVSLLAFFSPISFEFFLTFYC